MIRRATILLCILATILACGSEHVRAQHESVVGTLHNLSSSGPGEVRALSESQVCKFCHVPHNAVVPAPLWGHKLSDVEYKVARFRGAKGEPVDAPQPDGDSRLCLSCHDGTVALGDIAGSPRPIAMTGPDRLAPGRRGFLGTDISGSHPVSFVVQDRAGIDEGEVDMGLRPVSVIRSDGRVKLDSQGKMQCTTCHDAHSDRYYEPGKVPRFWVKPTVDGVCLTCHEPR